MSTGPNDPCHCGSGKKYKKCHMRADMDGTPRVQAPQATVRRDPLILNETEREQMRAACRFNAQLMDQVREIIKPGITTQDIDDFVSQYTLSHGHTCATLGYRGYTRNCCTSINDIVCHGIPSDKVVLKEGDIVNVDLTTIVDGFFGDQSETFFVGEVSEAAVRLTQCSFDGMWDAIDALTPSCRVIEIGRAIKKRASRDGFSVVEVFQGHGIGRKFHQSPAIPHFPDRYHGTAVLRPGMCFTIEPMINEGTKNCWVSKEDGWTSFTSDGKLSAQFEHTILMTEAGPEVMTLTKHGPQKGHKFKSPANVA
ncbi:MAG: type I methionyl aminopeptidase [Planctomycetes bacterium]|nr:type I methionyl aminopeptidase [Planctomycetota bacterium]